MRSIDRPPFSFESVYDACLNGIAVAERHERLINSRAFLRRCRTCYTGRAISGELHRLIKKHSLGEASAEDLRHLYDGQLSRERSAARSYYDRIKAGAGSFCPFCGINVVKEVDHFLPKTQYEAYSVFPDNLVPICRDCNREKSTIEPNAVDAQFLHPYFDQFPEEQWLRVEVSCDPPVTVDYEAVPPLGWSDNYARRVGFHFRMLKLGYLYSANAAGYLSENVASIKMEAESNGRDGVADFLISERRRYSVNPAGWKYPLLDALLNSANFLDYGYLNVGGL